MPDPCSRGRVAELERMTPMSRGTGGILDSPKYKSYSVEVRPPKWADKKIWIGKIKTFEDAQYVADTVRHYVGLPPHHFHKGFMTYPAITCIGAENGSPVELSNQAMCSWYVGKIAKGEKFKPQRVDFVQKVKDVVSRPDFPFLAPAPSKVITDDDDEDEDEMVLGEDELNLLQMSSSSGGLPVPLLQTHVTEPDSVRGSEAVQAYVPSFDLDLNGSEDFLRSGGRSFDALLFSMEDWPTGPSEDPQWIDSIEELCSWTPEGTSTLVAANEGDNWREWIDTIDPILNIPPTVSQSAKRRRIGASSRPSQA